ncbi:MAG TPA: hypothetical protein VEO01_15600, partial [Pseudonocardiaceae bacterium]|nr:hypothetical protein [Pseudonocardiaceae bacterium]
MKVIDRDRIHLAKGSHSGSIPEEPDCEVCFFEAYNLLTLPPGLANPIITDKRPPDVSLVLHRFGMRLNDVLPDDRRQTLKVYLPNGRSSLAGTVSDGLDDVRRWMAADWAVRTATPAWLDAAGQPEAAARLRALGPIVDRTTYEAAWTVVRPVRDEMRELRNARFAELRARYAAAAADAVADAVAAADADAAADAVADAAA